MNFENVIIIFPPVSEWMKAHKQKWLGVPRYIGSGLHEDSKSEKYRFMVMERFGTDLQKIFESNGKRFPRKTVLTLGIRIVGNIDNIIYLDQAHT